MMSFMASTGVIVGLVLLTNLFIPVKDNIQLAFNIVLVISVVWFFISYRIAVAVYKNRASLCILHCQQNVQILRIPRGKITDRPIFIILCIQTFTVCTMVPLMSLLGTIESSRITSNLIFIWLQTICLKFIMAYPLQILVVGPFCRLIFRHLFASTNQGNESKVEYEMEQQGFAE